MGILDKLRAQPRWRHADPAVRAAAVYEIGPEEGEALRALARDDADGRVRRAAVTRLEDVAALGDIARTDPDEEVRAEAVRQLAGLAAETDDPERAVSVVQRLAAVKRHKEVVLIARESAHIAVRAAVVDALDDEKSLSALSRHAGDGATRLRALARVADVDEILAVALKSEHTDAAVAALERIKAPDSLTAVSQRARNKVAARRARTRLRQLEEASRPTPDVIAAMSPDDRDRAKALVTRAEALVAVSAPEEAAAALADVRLAWAELQADAEVEEALTREFDAACDGVREAIGERERERTADEARAQATLREQATRLAICQEIETGLDALSGDAAEDRIAELKVQWDTLPPIAAEYAASLTRRFQDACRAFGERQRRRAMAEAAGPRLDALATELEQIVASAQAPEDVVARWRGLRRDADVLREHGAANPEAAERVERAVTTLEQQEQAHQQERARREQDHLRRLQQLCKQVETLAGVDLLTLKAGDRALRDIKTALETRQPLPSKTDRQEIQRRLELVRAVLTPRVQELRDADEWQRWANVQVQEELCTQMEALATEENLDVAVRQMRVLQGRWKGVALAPRTQGEALWQRFKTAQDRVFVRTSAHLAAQQEARAANLSKKMALIEQAEALAGSDDWAKTAAALQALQAEWKGIGPIAHGSEKAIWERFRAASDRFFTRRHEDLKRRKDDWAANLAKKEALCEAAEGLAASTEWEAAASQLKRLQAEWKTVGAVRKAKAEVVWQRFRAACDAFFERYKHRDQIALQGKVAPRDHVIRDLEGLLPVEGAEPTGAPDGIVSAVQQARTAWQQAPELPRALQQDMAARYHQALGRIVSLWPEAFAGTELDPVSTRKRMEHLLSKVEDLVHAQAHAVDHDESPTERLARQLRERLATNTITGGKAAEQDESKRRAAEQEVRSLQAQWTRLGPVPSDVAGPLNERFQRACRKFYDQHRRAS
jgi:hypothetical protein